MVETVEVVVVDSETEVPVIVGMVVKMVVERMLGEDVVEDGREGGGGSAGAYACNKVHFTL